LQLDNPLLGARRLPPSARLDALRHRGDAREKQFVASLAAPGLSVVDLRDARDAAATLDATGASTDVIVQAPLEHGRVPGLADPDLDTSNQLDRVTKLVREEINRTAADPPPATYPEWSPTAMCARTGSTATCAALPRPSEPRRRHPDGAGVTEHPENPSFSARGSRSRDWCRSRARPGRGS